MSLEAIIEENTAAHRDTAAAVRELCTVWSKLAAQGKNINKQVEEGTATTVRAGNVTIPVGKPEVPEEKAAKTPEPKAKPEAKGKAETAGEPGKADEPVTYDQVAKAITDGVKKDRQKVIDALAKFGAKKGPDLKAEQYAEFVLELAS